MRLNDLFWIAWVVMLVLKLTDVIQVSWWAVNSPLIIMFVLQVVITIAAVAYMKRW